MSCVCLSTSYTVMSYVGLTIVYTVMFRVHVFFEHVGFDQGFPDNHGTIGVI